MLGQLAQATGELCHPLAGEGGWCCVCGDVRVAVASGPRHAQIDIHTAPNKRQQAPVSQSWKAAQPKVLTHACCALTRWCVYMCLCACVTAGAGRQGLPPLPRVHPGSTTAAAAASAGSLQAAAASTAATTAPPAAAGVQAATTWQGQTAATVAARSVRVTHLNVTLLLLAEDLGLVYSLAVSPRARH